MSRKLNKTSTPKANGSNQKTPQLEMNLGGINLKSDVVYGKGSDIFRLLTSGLSKNEIDDITGFGYEVELSPTRMVTTTQYIVAQPIVGSNGRIWDNRTQRRITTGSLTFNKGKLTGSSTASSVEGSFSQSDPITNYPYT